MKKTLLILFFIPMIGFGQAVILFQNGDKQDAKILEITPEIVKYKKFNSTNPVVYTEHKSNLIGVIFEDGEFERFETKKGSSLKKRNFNQRDYGSNMFYLGPLDIFYGIMLNIGYEHYLQSRKSSIRIPLRLSFGDYSDFIHGSRIYNFWKIGFEHKFFPTGSNGIARGFLGYGVHHGGYAYNKKILLEQEGYDHSYGTFRRQKTRYFNAQFMGGIQIQPTELINLTMDIGIGPAYDYDVIPRDNMSYAIWAFWPSFSITLGFRF